MNDEQKKQIEYFRKVSGVNLFERFCVIYYRRIIVNLPKNFLNKNRIEKQFTSEQYSIVMRKANMNLFPEEYYMSSIFVGIFFFMALIFTTIVLFLNGQYIVAQAIFYLCTFLTILYFSFILNYPEIKAKSRASNIDASLLLVTPYFKILSKDLPLYSIVRLVSKFLKYKEISTEFDKINYYFNFLGFDINTSIKKAMQSCPSDKLRQMLSDLVSIKTTGGDAYLYLEKRTESENETIIKLEKKNIETLLNFSQIYIILLLILPLFMALLYSLMNIIDFSILAEGSNLTQTKKTVEEVIYEFTPFIFLLFFMPIAYSVFIYLINISKPVYKKLEIKQEDLK